MDQSKQRSTTSPGRAGVAKLRLQPNNGTRKAIPIHVLKNVNVASCKINCSTTYVSRSRSTNTAGHKETSTHYACSYHQGGCCSLRTAHWLPIPIKRARVPIAGRLRCKPHHKTKINKCTLPSQQNLQGGGPTQHPPFTDTVVSRRSREARGMTLQNVCVFSTVLPTHCTALAALVSKIM